MAGLGHGAGGAGSGRGAGKTGSGHGAGKAWCVMLCHLLFFNALVSAALLAPSVTAGFVRTSSVSRPALSCAVNSLNPLFLHSPPCVRRLIFKPLYVLHACQCMHASGCRYSTDCNSHHYHHHNALATLALLVIACFHTNAFDIFAPCYPCVTPAGCSDRAAPFAKQASVPQNVQLLR